MGRIVEVLDGGLATTIQDQGRPAAPAAGVAPGGVMDPWAAGWANALVGNPRGAAVLEATLLGPTLRFPDGATVALAGADMGVQLDGVAVPPGQAVRVPPGGELSAGSARAGVRLYLAVDGGIDSACWMGSRSADPAVGFGRPLRSGDRLPLGTARGRAVRWESSVNTCLVRDVVRVTEGPSAGGGLLEWLTAGRFHVSVRSDRVGVRLDPPDAARRNLAPVWPADWDRRLSIPMVTGAVQLTPDGTCFVLMAGRGVLGGYPVPAVVAAADRPVLAQAVPGAPLRMVVVSRGEAREAWAALQAAAPWR